MPSEAFDRFVFSCFDTSFAADHDGLDVDALRALEGAEREEAARLVLDVLRTTRESRPIIAAAYLALPEAIPLLRARLADSSTWPGRGPIPDTRISTAWSLYRLSHDPAAVTIVLDILKATEPDREFLIWSNSLHVLAEFDLTPQVLVAALELAIRVEPSVLATTTVVKLMGHRALGPGRFIMMNPWTKPREQRQLARRVWRELPEGERQRLDRALVEKLADTQSSLIVAILGLIESQAAAPIIHQIMQTGSPDDRVQCALALYRIEEYADAHDICASILFSDHKQWTRVGALESLMHMSPTPTIAAGLLQTVEEDHDVALRSEALLVLSELFPDVATIAAIARNAGAIIDETTPLDAHWQQPPAETMTALRAAVARALAAS